MFNFKIMYFCNIEMLFQTAIKMQTKILIMQFE